MAHKLEYLARNQKCAPAGKPAGQSYLYFGCRSKSKDYYYNEQFEAMKRSGTLAKEGGLQVACSRDQPQKVYVQQILAENSRQLFKLICEVYFHAQVHSGDVLPMAVAFLHLPADFYCSLEEP